MQQNNVEPLFSLLLMGISLYADMAAVYGKTVIGAYYVLILNTFSRNIISNTLAIPSPLLFFSRYMSIERFIYH